MRAYIVYALVPQQFFDQNLSDETRSARNQNATIAKTFLYLAFRRFLQIVDEILYENIAAFHRGRKNVSISRFPLRLRKMNKNNNL